MHQSNQKDPTPATVTIGPSVLLVRRREMSFRRERRPDVGNSQDTTDRISKAAIYLGVANDVL
jgi:hypothetical protein